MRAPLNAQRTGSREGGPSFSVANRIYRAIWNTVWVLLAAWTPPPLHGWRRFLLRSFGAKIAPTARVYSSARIWYPPNLTMDDYACLGPFVTCYCMAPTKLGLYAVVSQSAHLCAGTHDIMDPSFQLIAKPITLGDNSWVAAEAFVGPGVTLGEGAVLGARGVLFKDLAPWVVAVGNPAHIVKRRQQSAGGDLTQNALQKAAIDDA